MDEDTPSNSAKPDDEESDDDLAPDYTRLTQKLKPRHQTTSIPKRGIKDFESNKTKSQQTQLSTSRNAIWSTLSPRRVHGPAAGIGVGSVESSTSVKSDSGDLAQAANSSPVCAYDPWAKAVVVEPSQVRGSMFMRLGRDLSKGGVELTPEEALWAMEGGKLDLVYDQGMWSGADGAEHEHKTNFRLPVALQSAYTLMLGHAPGRPAVDEYQVYASLKRYGYIVLRPIVPSPKSGLDLHSDPEKSWMRNYKGFFDWLKSSFTRLSIQGKGAGSVVQPGFYRSYSDIYSKLKLINDSDSRSSRSRDTSENTPDPFTWQLHRPPNNTGAPDSTHTVSSSSWRKSSPGNPDFNMTIVTARHCGLSSLEQLDELMQAQATRNDNSTTTKPPSAKPSPVGRLKQGHNAVILAVVDDGVTSYLRIAEARFGRERLYSLPKKNASGKNKYRKAGGGRGT